MVGVSSPASYGFATLDRHIFTRERLIDTGEGLDGRPYNLVSCCCCSNKPRSPRDRGQIVSGLSPTRTYAQRASRRAYARSSGRTHPHTHHVTWRDARRTTRGAQLGAAAIAQAGRRHVRHTSRRATLKCVGVVRPHMARTTRRGAARQAQVSARHAARCTVRAMQAGRSVRQAGCGTWHGVRHTAQPRTASTATPPRPALASLRSARAASNATAAHERRHTQGQRPAPRKPCGAGRQVQATPHLLHHNAYGAGACTYT